MKLRVLGRVRLAVIPLLATAAIATTVGALLAVTTSTAQASAAEPSLLLQTGATPGEVVYAWPHFPSHIQIDNEAGLSGLRWSLGRSLSAHASGVLEVDLCSKNCASGPLKKFHISVEASRPKVCPVATYETAAHENYLYYRHIYGYSAVAGSVPAGSGAPAWVGRVLDISPNCLTKQPSVSDWPPMSWRGAPQQALKWAPASGDGLISGDQLVACANSASCVAVNPAGPETAYWNGKNWSRVTQFGRLGVAVTAVACSAPGRCFAADQSGDVMIFNGGRWSPARRVDPYGAISDITCATAGDCVAVDPGGHMLTYSSGRWSRPKLVDSAGTLRSVSCVGTNFCAAVDTTGHAVFYNGRSWSPARLADRGGTLIDVSCTSSRFCVAVNSFGRVVDWDGSAWSAPKYLGIGLTGVASSAAPLSCASAQLCVLVDGAGNTFTYNGKTWSAPAHIDSRGAALSSVSCPSATFCMAVDTGGNSFQGR